MKGERLSESQIIEYLKQDKIPTFQVRNKEELEKCSPFYYCSNKYVWVCMREGIFSLSECGGQSMCVSINVFVFMCPCSWVSG